MSTPSLTEKLDKIRSPNLQSQKQVRYTTTDLSPSPVLPYNRTDMRFLDGCYPTGGRVDPQGTEHRAHTDSILRSPPCAAWPEARLGHRHCISSRRRYPFRPSTPPPRQIHTDPPTPRPRHLPTRSRCAASQTVNWVLGDSPSRPGLVSMGPLRYTDGPSKCRLRPVEPLVRPTAQGPEASTGGFEDRPEEPTTNAIP